MARHGVNAQIDNHLKVTKKKTSVQKWSLIQAHSHLKQNYGVDRKEQLCGDQKYNGP